MAPRKRGMRLVIAGAKGGVGKTVLSTAIGLQAASNGRRVILVDADFNLPTLAISFDLFPEKSLGDVLRGERQIEEILVYAKDVKPAEGSIKIIPGDFDISGLGQRTRAENTSLTTQLSRLAELADLVVYDTASCSGAELDVVLPLADRVLVVMTAEPCGLAGACATLRVIQQYPDLSNCIGLLVNLAPNKPQAEQYAQHLISTAKRTLGLDVQMAGYILSDPHVREAMRTKQQFILESPNAPASMAVKRLVAQMEQNGLAGGTEDHRGFWSWFIGR